MLQIEPDVDYFCKLDYDPFLFMKTTGKKYGFNIVASEDMQTMSGFWTATLNFLKLKKRSFPEHLKAFGDERSYNGVHFWYSANCPHMIRSNFEIGDLRWYRSQEYQDYFDSLDHANGVCESLFNLNQFFYERWGDAPVHSVAVGLFLDPSEVHYFGDIGM